MKVLVAGAGLSGMYAAWQLEKAGHEVQVVEAKDRVGGRTWSQQMSNGEWVERGGEFVFPTDHLMRQVAAELSLPIVTHGIVFSRRWSEEGGRLSVLELQAEWKKFLDVVRSMEATGDRSSTLDDAARMAWGANFKSLPAYIRFVTSLANDASKVSAASLAARHASEESLYFEHGGRLQEGNQGVCKGIAKLLSKPVLFNRQLTGFSQDKTGVRFILSDGEVLTADAAVLSVPLLILRALDGYRTLGPLVQKTLDCRVMGTAAKISVVTKGQAPSRGVQYPGATWWCWNSLAKDDDSGRPAVTGFAGGHGTVAELNVADGGKKWASRIARLRPDLELTDEVLVTDWTVDPLTQGAYTAAGIDWQPDFATAFDAPSGRLAIAGEHTWESTMNGALLSGKRAAKLISQLSA